AHFRRWAAKQCMVTAIRPVDGGLPLKVAWNAVAAEGRQPSSEHGFNATKDLGNAMTAEPMIAGPARRGALACGPRRDRLVGVGRNGLHAQW
ncbi:MAG TPA: hypothetical protein PKD29_04360, partial [Rhodocyclaceae bacterium]|nr:hypothetical protein [Rhodocyclaceae bacterium]